MALGLQNWVSLFGRQFFEFPVLRLCTLFTEKMKIETGGQFPT